MIYIKNFISIAKDYLSRIFPAYMVNKIGLTIIVFIIWMIFFDKNKLINQWQLSQSITRLEKEKVNLSKMILEAKKDKADLDVNKEKYAREKYYMHKENEDIFIFEESLKSKNERISK